MSDSARIPVLVLGLGNILCGDDGTGVIAIHKLRRNYEMPAGVRAVDGGTLGLDLLALVAASDHVIILDAVRADAPPGTPVRLAGADVAPAVYERLSPHQVGVGDLLAGVTLCARAPVETVIVGIVPETTELRLGCTPVVVEQLDALVERAVAEIARLGYAVRRREVPEPPSDSAARALGL